MAAQATLPGEITILFGSDPQMTLLIHNRLLEQRECLSGPNGI